MIIPGRAVLYSGKESIVINHESWCGKWWLVTNSGFGGIKATYVV